MISPGKNFIAVLLVMAAACAAVPEDLHCYNSNTARNEAAVYKKNDSAMSAVVNIKKKIAVERDAILEDGRRLQQARKSGDKAVIDQVKRETDLDIAQRKAAIKKLKNELGNIESGGINFDKRRKDR